MISFTRVKQLCFDWLFLIGVVGFALFVAYGIGHSLFYAEANSEQYQEAQEFARIESVKPMIFDALSDGELSVWEYVDIKQAAKRNQLIELVEK